MGNGRRAFVLSQDGSVILETALMITVLLLLTFGMVDFGRVMYASNSLISAARDGARFGAVQASPVSATAVQAVVRGRFNQYTFGGDTLRDADITVTDSSALSPPSVKVAITYTFKWITPVARLMNWTNGGSFTSNLHATSQYRYESQ